MHTWTCDYNRPNLCSDSQIYIPRCGFATRYFACIFRLAIAGFPWPFLCIESGPGASRNVGAANTRHDAGSLESTMSLLMTITVKSSEILGVRSIFGNGRAAAATKPRVGRLCQSDSKHASWMNGYTLCFSRHCSLSLKIPSPYDGISAILLSDEKGDSWITHLLHGVGSPLHGS